MIGLWESELDRTVLDPETYIENFEILRSNRNRHGGVACDIKKDIS